MNIYRNIAKKMQKKLLLTLIFLLSTAFVKPIFSGVLDDAAITDINKLCNSQPSQALYNIANKKKNSDELKRNALESMMEVSRECAAASSQRLKQYHQKMISTAYKILELPEMESRKVAVEAIQYIILQPDQNKPPEGAIGRGNKLADVALNDSDVNIRLWALEALVMLRGDNAVRSTLEQIIANDSQAIMVEVASEMLNDIP